MDLLLRLLERRTIVVLSVGLVATALALRFWGVWLEKADMLIHPPVTDVNSPLAASIIRDNEAREKAKIRGLHRAVSAEIAAARAKGFDVEKLQTLADQILAADRPQYRDATIERLNKLRMAIPQKKDYARTANAEDMNPDTLDAPAPKKSKRRR